MCVGHSRAARAVPSEAPRARLWLAVVLALAVSGCATFSSSFAVIESQLAAQQFGQALETLEKQGYSRRDEVLYLLNQGMLRRMNGDFAGSNQSLEAAKVRMEELYGASLTEQTLSFVINDATKSYVGEEYEQVLVHLYKALNYLQLHQLDEARVEALQVDIRLREIGEKFSEAQYTEDAFARYLTGMIYEEREEWSDALIAYRKAYEAYQKSTRKYAVAMPHALQIALLRLTQHQGLTAELEKYRKEFGIARWPSVTELREQGELVFILHNGLAPIKRERAVMVPDPRLGHIVRVSTPYYESRGVAATGARVSARPAADPRPAEHASAPAPSAGTELMEDIDAIARKSLDAKLPGITARALARAVAKRAISKAAQQAGRSSGDRNDAMAALILGIGVEAATFLTERADTRSWLTLPHDIRLARLPLPPGNYTVKVDLLGYGDQVIGTREYSVAIERGRKHYLSYHHVATTYPAARR